jgi:hypothetical protein
MEMTEAAVDGARAARGQGTRERLAWLVGLCLLSWRQEQILATLIGLGGDEPALAWWTRAALATRLAGVEEEDLERELGPEAALQRWGLVRAEDGRVAVNLRIARFLIG